MFAPSELSPRTRDVAARTIHRVWGWVSAVGMVGPNDPRGRRFAYMGPRSGISFPPGDVMGERWISIGAETLIGASVSLAVGMPGEVLETDAPVIVIGDRCSVGRGTTIVGRCGITIGDDVTIAPNVYITDHNHGYEDADTPIKQQWPTEAPVRIGSGSWLAAGATVLPGADIGRNVTVAAGAVVRGVVPDHTIVAGVPARAVRHFERGVGWVSSATDQ